MGYLPKTYFKQLKSRKTTQLYFECTSFGLDLMSRVTPLICQEPALQEQGVLATLVNPEAPQLHPLMGTKSFDSTEKGAVTVH